MRKSNAYAEGEIPERSVKVWSHIAVVLLVAILASESNASENTDRIELENANESVNYVSTEDFDTEVLSSELPVLVVFTAEWCGPCKILDPVIESLLPELSERARVFKVDTDESPEISSRYEVSRLPTIIFFL